MNPDEAILALITRIVVAIEKASEAYVEKAQAIAMAEVERNAMFKTISERALASLANLPGMGST